ncbi:MAG: LysE family transporter [Anaerolineae bacterium]|nr:LysE family transporter [Anaerolineae bacterium]
MKELLNGLLTGLTLQLAIGPVFFFIINLTLQKTIFDGFACVLAVTLVDYFYITLSILGIGKLLENPKVKKIFGVISSVVLVLFGLSILKGLFESSTSNAVISNTSNILTSFTSVFLITISSPLTIVFFTSLFTAKVVEYNYTKKELTLFGLGTGLATFLFMGTSVILFSLIKETVPLSLMQVLNGIVGVLLVGYGIQRLYKNLKQKS